MRFIPMHLVQPGMMVGRDIISQHNAKMITKGMVLNEDSIGYLFSHGYLGVYISDLISEDIEVNEPINPVLFKKGVEALASENVGHIFNVATEIVRDISKQPTVGLDLIDLRSFDDYTYHHSVNVAVYAVAVGKKMGLSEKDIASLSQAAICHDLGKIRISETVLNKPGKLTDEEYELIKQHPKMAWEILSKSNEVSAVVKQAVLFHHENENGSGYPMHKKGSELSLITKIIHAVDVYDALTSKRPYKEPYAPVAAFEYLKGGRDILFDRKVVDAMIQVIPIYPPGTDVKLSDGRLGVVSRHTVDPLRPVIKIIPDGSVCDLCRAENQDITIIESGFMISDYASEVELLNETRNKKLKSRQSIIVIDNKVNSLMKTKEVLEGEYEVITLSAAFDALSYIKKEGAPDLIITDVELPVMDGFAFIKTLRNNGYKGIPVIVMSADTSKETVVKCINSGAADYILKPAKPVYLMERVGHALKKDHE